MRKYVIPVELIWEMHSVTDNLDLPWTKDLIQIVTNPVLIIGTDTVEA